MLSWEGPTRIIRVARSSWFWTPAWEMPWTQQLGERQQVPRGAVLFLTQGPVHKRGHSDAAPAAPCRESTAGEVPKGAAEGMATCLLLLLVWDAPVTAALLHSLWSNCAPAAPEEEGCSQNSPLKQIQWKILDKDMCLALLRNTSIIFPCHKLGVSKLLTVIPAPRWFQEMKVDGSLRAAIDPLLLPAHQFKIISWSIKTRHLCSVRCSQEKDQKEIMP